MVAPTVYKSTDASAPTLNGTVGSLITVLDAVLVNGYGAKAAAGWTKPYTGTNLAAYRMATGGTSRQMYLRIDDTGAKTAYARGYDGMTAISTGTEDFPTAVQVAAGLMIEKSNTADSTARPWVILATPTCFYLWVETNSGSISSSGNTYWGQFFFGEYPTYVGSFTYNCAIVGKNNGAGSGNVGATLGLLPQPNSIAGLLGHYLCRNYNNVAGAANFCKYFQQMGRSDSSGYQVLGQSGGLGAPDVVTGKAFAARVRIIGPSWALMGHFPGFHGSLASSLLGNQLDTINGTSALAGRSFLCMDVSSGGTIGGSTNINGRGLFDLSNFD